MRIGPSSAKLHPAIISEASAWFVEFRAEDVTGEARERFIEWLRRSPEHIQAYLEVAGSWAELPSEDPEGRIDVAALIDRARKDQNVVALERLQSPGLPSASTCVEASVSAPAVARSRSSHRRQYLVAAAAVAAFAITSAAFVLTHVGVYTTGIGEQRTIALADGSTVELNARSRIRLRLESHQRNVALLEGQALFHVAKDAGRPFIVQAGETQVRAVGTEFDVNRKATATVITVVEGRVSVSTPAIAAQLPPTLGSGASGAVVPVVLVSAGEQLTVTAQTVSRPKPADAAAATAWVQKRLMFEETPLSDVADEFNRYNTLPLIIEDPQVQHLRISGIYSSTDPVSLLNFLRSQPTIEVIEGEHEVRIIRREVH
jgi:transmembrane sensor